MSWRRKEEYVDLSWLVVRGFLVGGSTGNDVRRMEQWCNVNGMSCDCWIVEVMLTVRRSVMVLEIRMHFVRRSE